MTKIAFIGDSYTAGYLLPDINKRWSSVLCSKLGATEVNVSKSGSGFCMRGAGATFAEQAQQTVNLGQDFDIIFVAGGHNDAESSNPLATIETNVHDTFRILRDGYPNAKIYVLTFWHYYSPSERIMAVDSIMTRVGALYGAVEVDNSVMWRVNRREWSFDDGHPNEAGAALIATLVKARLFDDPEGTENYGRFVRPFVSDASFSGTANVAEGTIFNARAGLWRLEGRATMYGPVGGWSFVAVDYVPVAQRSDLSGTPTPIVRSELVVHAGGDMRISLGYTTLTGGTAVVIGNGSAVVEATFVM